MPPFSHERDTQGVLASVPLLSGVCWGVLLDTSAGMLQRLFFFLFFSSILCISENVKIIFLEFSVKNLRFLTWIKKVVLCEPQRSNNHLDAMKAMHLFGHLGKQKIRRKKNHQKEEQKKIEKVYK